MKKLSLIILITLLTACVPEGGGSRSGNFSNQAPTNSLPDDNSGEPNLNSSEIYFYHNQVNSSKLQVSKSFNGQFLVRGGMINEYLSQNSTNNFFCLINKFNQGVLSLKATKKSYFDFTSKSTLFYLEVSSEHNSNECQSSEIQTKLTQLFTAAPIYFSLDNVCSSCNQTDSSQIHLMDPIKKEIISSVLMSSLQLSITSSATPPPTGPLTCNNNSECGSNYDCCNSNICISHGSIKTGTNTSDINFLGAQGLIATGEAQYSDYPLYYNSCPGYIPPTEPGDNSEIAKYNLNRLTDLAQCLSEGIDELAICSKVIENFNESTASSNLDDLNFSSISPSIPSSTHNIVEVRHAGSMLYQTGNNIANLVFSNSNDDLNQAEMISGIPTPSIDSAHKNLVIKFKIDRTCRKQGSYVRCDKYYTLGQISNPIRPSDSAIGQTVFNLPGHANSSTLKSYAIVYIDHTPIAQSASGWEWNGSQIRINQTLNPGQQIRISYLSNLPINSFSTYLAAQAELRSHCQLTNDDHMLEPVYSANGTLVTYECKQKPNINPNDPLQKTISLNMKTAPVVLYNNTGLKKQSISQATEQEGSEFKYTQGNYIPNNLTQYIGFNEIYGNLIGQIGAHPAQEITVVKGRIYDLYSGTGVFTPCPTCGTSVYGNTLQKIFPEVSALPDAKGGGYSPSIGDERSNNSITKYNREVYRANDLLFGRACFLPASMIPWTHNQGSSNSQTQRLNRLSAQHALFTNGYNRDWFGFDYGSIIGSFDGIKWFSIGEKRRITAKSNRLYLAINAYYSDLTQANNMSVEISEVTDPQSGGAKENTHDMQSTGAQCQINHICDTDRDCISQLGYEYTCQNVGSLESNWPVFDINANELIGSQTLSISSMIGGLNSESKRCVYRGAGAPCQRNTTITGSAFNKSNSIGLQSCAPNFYCAEVSSSSFNTKIARIPFSARSQNSNSDLVSIIGETDLFGKNSRLLGRSLNYYGDESLNSSAQSQLLSHGVDGICVPGKDPNITSSFKNQMIAASGSNNADKMLGIGVTTPTLQSDSYYNSCPATDSSGQYIHLGFNNQTTDYVTATQYAASQNLSTDFLNAFNITDLFVGPSPIENFGYQANRCLRAPGASCFSDLECAPSKFIANQIKNNTSSSGLTEAEENFWKEDLVCSQAEPRFINIPTTSGSIINRLNNNFELKNNRCCRQTNKELHIATELFINTAGAGTPDATTPDTTLLAGVDTNINSPRRYSRVNTIYDLLGQGTHPALQGLSEGSINQVFDTSKPYYKTFDAMAQRTCCSKNWVRKFHADNNGANNEWGPDRMQSIDKSVFKNINWRPNTNPSAPAFECGTDVTGENYFLSTNCEIENITPADQDTYLNYIQSLELTGVPQVFITGNDSYSKTKVDADQNVDNSSFIGEFLTGSFNTSNGEVAGSDSGKFSGDIKQIFSEDRVRCCVPSSQGLPIIDGQIDQSKLGIAQDASMTDDMCCSGNYNQSQRRCCVPDYTNITVYLNRYISSEASHLSESNFDNNGFIRDKNTVLNMASKICCSGRAGFGRAIANLPIPSSNGQAIQDNNSSDGIARTQRFLYRSQGEIAENGDDIGSFYDKGARWNNQVYCLPAN